MEWQPAAEDGFSAMQTQDTPQLSFSLVFGPWRGGLSPIFAKGWGFAGHRAACYQLTSVLPLLGE